MAGVSPWFSTHYGRDTYNKNFIYRGDDWLFAERWEDLVNNRSSIPFAEVITWNDYGESSYISPIEGVQPMSESWVNGYDHQGTFSINKPIHTFQSLTKALQTKYCLLTDLRTCYYQSRLARPHEALHHRLQNRILPNNHQRPHLPLGPSPPSKRNGRTRPRRQTRPLGMGKPKLAQLHYHPSH